MVFRATRHNKIEIVKYLLKQNVDADAKNINNQTALHNACFKGAHEIVQVLLEHGVSYDSKNLDGDCPAHLAVKGKTCKKYATLQFIAILFYLAKYLARVFICMHNCIYICHRWVN